MSFFFSNSVKNDEQKSGLYFGTVWHARHSPSKHRFRLPAFFSFVDLAEIENSFSKSSWWTTRIPGIQRYCRKDYLAPTDIPLRDAVCQKLREHGVEKEIGAIRLFTQLRSWGHIFNPVSFYYCYDHNNQNLIAVLAEITNIPWGERHCYVVHKDQSDNNLKNTLQAEFKKRFHISPFNPMNQFYHWTFSEPNDLVSINMQNKTYAEYSEQTTNENGICFSAGLSMQKARWTRRNLFLAPLLFPFQTVAVVFFIHFHALMLLLKGIPFHVHPKHKLSQYKQTHQFQRDEALLATRKASYE